MNDGRDICPHCGRPLSYTMQVNPHAPGLHDILSGAWGQVARWYFAFALAALVIGLVIAGEGVVG